MSRALNLVLDHALHRCSGCAYWSEVNRAVVDGYIVASCIQPADSRDHKIKRGGDKCQYWKRAG